MRILSTTMVYPTPAAPGKGLFVQRRLRAMKAAGADVHVVCPLPWFLGYTRGAADGEIDEPVPTVYRRMPYVPGVAKCLDGWLYARTFERAARALQERSPFALIDAHFEYPDGVGAVRAARRLGLPVCVTLRGKLHSQVRYRLRRGQVRRMLCDADGLIAVAGSLKDAAIEVAGRPLDVRVIPNGVDPAVFHPIDAAGARRELGLADGPRYVVSVGHLQELKGFHRLVEVWPALRAAVGDVRLLLVGGPTAEADYGPRLHEQIERLGLRDVVTSLGRQPAERINALLNAADCFALSTRSEGCCNAIQESLCAGTPVVTTAVGGNPELVHADSLGVLVPFGDADRLRDALIDALRRPWDRHAIAAAGSQRTWDVVARECLTYYEEIVARAAKVQRG